MTITVYYTSHGFIEVNTVMAALLGWGDHVAILFMAFVWTFFFSAYYYLRGTRYATILAFMLFSIFSFNLVHDLGVIL